MRLKILLTSKGQNSLIVDLSLTPASSLKESNSTGNHEAWYSTSRVSCLLMICLFSASQGLASQLKSHLISIISVGIPSADNHSIKSCTVFVFPVQVAPAIRPCLLSVLRGSETGIDGSQTPSIIPLPKRSESHSKVYPSISDCEDIEKRA